METKSPFPTKNVGREELSSHKETWKNLKCVFLSERSHFQRVIYGNNSHFIKFWKRQNYSDRRLVVSRGQGVGQGGMNRWSMRDFLRQ